MGSPGRSWAENSAPAASQVLLKTMFFADTYVDRAYAHDGTGVLALEAWKEMGGDRLGEETGYYIQFDHIAPANNGTTATLQHELREFAKSSGFRQRSAR